MTTYYQDSTTDWGVDGAHDSTRNLRGSRSTVRAGSSKVSIGIAVALMALTVVGVGAEVTMDALSTPDSITVGDGPTSTQETTLIPTPMGTETDFWRKGIPAQGNLNRPLPTVPGIPAQGNLNQSVGH